MMKPWMPVALTTLAATLVRVWFPRAWGELHAPASVFYEGDARAYLDYAAHLVNGLTFDNGVPFHPPGWPFVLSVVFRLAGFDPIDGVPVDQSAIKTFVAILSGATVGLTALLASRLYGRGAMLAVAVIGTFSFPHVVQGSAPNADALYGLLVAATMLLAWRWYAAGPVPRQAAVLGGVAGFATLVRPEFVVCALLLATGKLVAADRARTVSGRASSAPTRSTSDVAFYAIAFMIVLTPTTIWHWRSISTFNETRAARLPGPLPRFAPVTSYGAFNFANANHEQAPGGFNFDSPALRPQTPEEEKQFDEGYLDLSLPSVHHVFVNGYSIGLRWMSSHPGDALALIGRKALITSGVFAHGYLQTNVGAGVDGTRRPVDLVDPSSRWLWLLHVALVAAGAWLVAAGRRVETRTAWVLFSPLASLAGSSLLFYGYVRLGAAYLPAFWVLQGIALAWIASRVPIPAFARARAGLLVAALVALLLIVEAAGLAARRHVVLTGSTAPDGSLVRDALVTIRRTR